MFQEMFTPERFYLNPANVTGVYPAGRVALHREWLYADVQSDFATGSLTLRRPRKGQCFYTGHEFKIQ
jgi:hypothetical protein